MFGIDHAPKGFDKLFGPWKYATRVTLPSGLRLTIRDASPLVQWVNYFLKGGE